MKNRIAYQEYTTNEYDNVANELNDFMIAIKLHQSEKIEEKFIEARKRYPLPTPEECDMLHYKLIDIIKKFDTPIRKR